MQRIIKFRQPIFIKNKFSYWHYWGFNKNVGFIAPVTGLKTMEEVEKESQQFIGLHDKNGKEIFEGDKVESFLFEHHSVKPQEGEGRWYRKKEGQLTKRTVRIVEYSSDRGAYKPFGYHSYDCGGGEVEVIGNIYENPWATFYVSTKKRRSYDK